MLVNSLAPLKNICVALTEARSIELGTIAQEDRVCGILRSAWAFLVKESFSTHDKSAVIKCVPDTCTGVAVFERFDILTILDCVV